MKVGEIVVATAVIGLFVVGMVLVGVYMGQSRPVPRCQEDAVLVGEGDFNKGRWTGYVCGPALDDFAQ